MIPPEAVLGQPPHPPLDPVTPAGLVLTAGELPGMRDDRELEHEWPASIFIFLTKLSVWGLAIGAIGFGFLAFSGDGPPSLTRLATAGGLAIGAVLQHHLAKNVEGFTRWGWYGAIAELTFATLAKVNVLLSDPLNEGIGALVGIAIDLLWMRYFWERRADYGVEIDL